MQREKAVLIAKLVKGVKKGNKRSFYLLYQQTWEGVYYTLLRNSLDEHTAKDLLNEVFIKVYNNINKLDNDMSFVAWLNKLLNNVYLDYLRANKKFQLDESYEESTEIFQMQSTDEEFMPDAAFEKKESQQKIKQVVNELPSLQRQAIFLFYYESLSIKEIADVADCSENTVYKRLHDAKKTLKTKLSEFSQRGYAIFIMADFNVLKTILKEEVKENVSTKVGVEAFKTISSGLSFGKAATIVAMGAAKTAAAMSAVAATVAVVTIATTTLAPISTQNFQTAQTQPTSLSQAQVEQQTLLPDLDFATENLLPKQIETLETIPPTETIEANETVEANETNDAEISEIVEQTNEIIINPLQTEVAEIEIEQQLTPTSVPIIISEQFAMTYEINEILDNDALINDIAINSGGLFDAKTAEITVVNNDYNGAKIGKYNVSLQTKQGERQTQIETIINVTDTQKPVITISNPKLLIEVGQAKTLEEILNLAQIEITDNSNETLNLIATNFEKIDFTIENLYAIPINATDSSGNDALQTNIIIQTIKQEPQQEPQQQN